MKAVLFFMLVSSTVIGTAQVYHIPSKYTQTTKDIADYITARTKDESQIARSVYTWVVNNIRYDTDSSNRINLNPDPELKITAALRRRRGVCENYAAIFNDILLKAGLQSYVVGGYTRQGSRIDRTGHAWCAVKVNNEWALCDPTWDEGSGTYRYFLADPADFIQTHMPFDPMWQLLKNPVTRNDFDYGSFYTGSQVFNYNDSINAYVQMNELERLQSASQRIQQAGINNDVVRNNHAVARMNIEMIHEDRDMDLYNAAVAELNKATVALNNFIRYRNDRFEPLKPDNEIKALLSGVQDLLIDSEKKLDLVDKSAATLTLTTDVVRQKSAFLAARFRDQLAFLNSYLKAAIVDRPKLFYN
jgi:hypothetical protein